MATEKCPLCGRKTENGKCEQCGGNVKNNMSDMAVKHGLASNDKILEIVKEVRMAEAKAKNKKYTVQLIITITVIVMMVIVICISLFINYSRITRAVSKLMGNSSENTISQQVEIPTVTSVIPEITDVTKITTQKIDKSKLRSDKGRWSSGIYEIGKEIPEGTYLVMTDGQASELFPLGLYSDAQARDEDNFIGEAWAGFSRYITITEPGFIKVSWANIFDIEENDIVNDPHKHSGMFLVGRDIEPGTYQLTFDRYYNDYDSEGNFANYYIYSDVDAVTPIIEERGKFEEGLEITLEEGDFLRLEECLIKE